jgi:hypothetical protein
MECVMTDVEKFLIYLAVAIAIGSLLALVRQAGRAVDLLRAIADKSR